jgi:hypothetical protein
MLGDCREAELGYSFWTSRSSAPVARSRRIILFGLLHNSGVETDSGVKTGQRRIQRLIGVKTTAPKN